MLIQHRLTRHLELPVAVSDPTFRMTAYYMVSSSATKLRVNVPYPPNVAQYTLPFNRVADDGGVAMDWGSSVLQRLRIEQAQPCHNACDDLSGFIRSKPNHIVLESDESFADGDALWGTETYQPTIDSSHGFIRVLAWIVINKKTCRSTILP